MKGINKLKQCSCCGKKNKKFNYLFNKLHLLEGSARLGLGVDFEFTITSGYRCKQKNKSVGGSEQSGHLLGVAADIKPPRVEQLFYLADCAVRDKFTGVICYADKGRYHLHVDDKSRKYVGARRYK